MEWKNEKNELERLINVEHVSYEKIGRQYGVSGNAVKKAAIALGIEIPQRRKINPKEYEAFANRKKTMHICQNPNCGKEFEHKPGTFNKYCSLKCQQEHRHIEAYKKIVNGDEYVMRANYSPSIFRDMILEEQGGICQICKGEPKHNGRPLVFIVDHIDGNAANNKRDNLRCICPNCDSQLDTYKSKNKNGARSYYRYHKDK